MKAIVEVVTPDANDLEARVRWEKPPHSVVECGTR
jgi:hypothetical protein